MCCLDYDDQSSHTSIIRAHYVFLLETLDVKFSGLVGQLFADQVVSAAERDDISAEQTSFRANEKLLSVLSRKSPQQFQLFLDALDNCGQPHVRSVVDDRRGVSIKITKFISFTHEQLCVKLLFLVHSMFGNSSIDVNRKQCSWDQESIIQFNRFLFLMWQRKPFCVSRMSSKTSSVQSW